MNVILEKTQQVPFFTNMRLVLNGLGLSAADFDWFLSDVETNCYGDELPSKDGWLEGARLQRLLENHEIQFIWAVFSAFPKGHRQRVEVAPYVDGNPNYWNGSEPEPQLPGALFEIACWDSSATILIGLQEKALASFHAAFPDSKPLSHAAALRRAG